MLTDLYADLFRRHLKEDKSCDCGYREENAKHYLIECPRHSMHEPYLYTY